MTLRPESYHAGTNPFSSVSGNHYDMSSLPVQNGSILASLCAFTLFLYYIISHFDVLPVPISRVLWNILVRLTPSRIILALDRTAESQDEVTSMAFPTFQTKSEAMQRIFGLDRNSLYSILPRARSLSGLGNALLGGKEPIPPGLGNWDNSCYQNSIIQGLASLRSFEAFLERNIQDLADRTTLATHRALRDIIERLNDPANHGQTLWTPPELKSMSSWQQQDAQEYFSKIVDQIDKEISQASKRLTSNLGLKVAGPQEHVLGVSWVSEDRRLHVRNTQKYASLRNPLEGLLAQRVGCMRCSWTEGLALIPFNCLTVSLGRNWEYDIRECLDDYMTLEPIEGVECAKCTLLRTKEQLNHLLKQIGEDEELANGAQTPKLTDALKISAQTRLQAVQQALDDEDFTEETLSKQCHIPSKNRVSTTKSRQAVIARAPKSLVIHVNRSVFDENTGVLRKNYADVRFPKIIDLDEWCLGTKVVEKGEDATERWVTDPQQSMLPQPGITTEVLERRYELRAVITHYGRHENGHYICYRKYSFQDFPANIPEAVLEADGEKEKRERWFRLSDDDVQMVSEQSVFSQGGVFMLFYECIEELCCADEETFHEAQSEIDQKSLVNGQELNISTTSEEAPSYRSSTSEPLSEATSIRAPGGSSSAESDGFDSDTSVGSRSSSVLPDSSSPRGGKLSDTALRAILPEPSVSAVTHKGLNERSSSVTSLSLSTIQAQ
jgi:ubiquitin carboxyl-terminal hydrolase 1